MTWSRSSSTGKLASASSTHGRTASGSSSTATAITDEPRGRQLAVDLLPARQVVAAPAPRRERDEQLLAALEVAERDGIAVDGVDGEVGRLQRGHLRRPGATRSAPARRCARSASTTTTWSVSRANTARSMRPSSTSSGHIDVGTQTAPRHRPSGLRAQSVASGQLGGVDEHPLAVEVGLDGGGAVVADEGEGFHGGTLGPAIGAIGSAHPVRPLLSRDGQRLEEEEPEQEAAAQAAQAACPRWARRRTTPTSCTRAARTCSTSGWPGPRAAPMNIIIIVAVLLFLALGVCSP